MVPPLPPGSNPADLDGASPRDPATTEAAVVLLHAEDLSVGKRRTTRTVQVARGTRSHDRVVQESLTNTSVEIEHVPIGTFVDAMPPVREEAGVTILPVVEEVVVVERRLRLVEEIRIRQVQSTSTHVETVVLREQHVVVTRSDPVIQEAPSLPSRAEADRVPPMPSLGEPQ